jgi:hypothetical protein
LVVMSEAAQNPRVSAAIVRPRVEGGWLLGVVAKRTYRIVGATCQPADAQLPLVEEPVIDPQTGELLQESELIITREHVDFVLLGHARVPRPTPACLVTLRADSFQCAIQVTGERRVNTRADGSLVFSPPKVFDAMPLSWAHAYGGVDRVGLAEIGDPFANIAAESGAPMLPTKTLFAYPRNPFGRGYVIEGSPAALEACELPNLELPGQELTPDNIVRGHFVHWPLAPLPAATGWLSYTAFPRACQLGFAPSLYDVKNIGAARFAEVNAGWLRAASLDASLPLAERIDILGASQGAALNMRMTELAPDAACEFSNVHARQATWSWSLSGEVPKLGFRLPGRVTDVLTPRIRAFIVEPDLDRCSVLWVGTRELNEPLTPKDLEHAEHGVTWQ